MSKIQFVELNWQEPSLPKLQDILGNEHAKRALEVSLSGSHCVLFTSTSNSPAAQLLSVGARIAKTNGFPFKGYVVPVCPCGAYGNPKIECTCTTEAITDYSKSVANKTVDAVMFVETTTPMARDTGRSNEDEAAMVARVLAARASGGVEAVCGDAEQFLRMAISEIGCDRAKALAVAGTIAKVDGNNIIQAQHVAEAVQYTRGIVARMYDQFASATV